MDHFAAVSFLPVYNNRVCRFYVIVDRPHRIVRCVDTAVGTVIGVDASAEATSPAGVMDAHTGMSEWQPVVYVRRISLSGQRIIGRLIEDIIDSGRRSSAEA